MLDVGPFLACLLTTHFLVYRIFYHNNQGVVEQKTYIPLVMIFLKVKRIDAS